MSTRAALAVVVISFLAVGLVDWVMLPGRHIPILELVPILIAASLRPPIPLLAVAAVAFIMHLVSAYQAGFPSDTTIIGSVALVATTYLAVLLSRQREEAERGRRDADAAHTRVRGVLESISDAFFALDRQWRFTYVNREAERLLARPRDKLLGRSIWDEFPEAVGSTFYQEYHKVAAEGAPAAFVEYYPPLDKWFEVHAYPAQDGLSVYFQDVGIRKRAEEEREEALADLEATIMAIPDAVMIYYPDGQIRRANPAAAQIVGLSPSDFARPIAERTAMLRVEHPNGSPLDPNQNPAVRALRGETVRGQELMLHPPAGGTVWVSASAAQIRSADGRLLGAVQTLVDITAQKQLMEQRDDFVRAISHDLRQPLTVILGQAEIAQSEDTRAASEARRARSLGAIVASARRMNAMIDDLVDSARLDAGQLTLKLGPVRLPEFVAELKDRVTGSGEGERIRIVPAQDLPPVLADPGKLERILGNLLANALKYSPPTSPVVVSLDRGDGKVVVAVRDQGSGIASEELPHLFDRYYRAQAGLEHRREGLGLGLYIVKGLVEAHGGSVWAESAPGEGSTFSFSLPAATD